MSDAWRKANFLWIGSKLSPVEILALKSYLAKGWDVTIYTYEDVEGVPSGCTIKDGREILDNSLIFKDPKRDAPGVSYANFSDLFRWSLLSRQAGWWFDMDMVAITPPRPIPGDAPVRFASTWEVEWGQAAITCAMFSDGHAEIYREAFKRASDVVAKGGEWDFPELGPFNLQRLVRENNFERYVAPWWEFCPYPWRQIQASCAGSTRDHVKNMLRVVKHTARAATGATVRPARLRFGTRAVHLHNEIWRLAGISKAGPFSRHSFVGRQMLKHRVPGVIVV